jgi:transcriptional regulator with XRE-family HTH domain
MKLRLIRESKNLSVPKLAVLSGVPRRTIQDIENGADMRISTAKKLAAALNVTLDELCKEGL